MLVASSLHSIFLDWRSMPMRGLRAAARTVGFVVLALACAEPEVVFAQDLPVPEASEAANAATGASGAVAPHAAVPAPTLAELAARADADEQLAARVERIMAEPDRTDELARRLEGISTSADALMQAYSPRQLRRMPVMRLESLARHWRLDKARFDEWQAELKRVTNPLLETSALLAQRRADWQARRARATVKELPPAAGDRIDAIIASLRRAEEQLAVPLSAQIALRQRASVVDARIRQGQGAVTQAIEDIDRQLLRIDAPAIWAASASDADAPDAAVMMRQGIDVETRFAKEYGSAENARLLALHVLQLLLLPLFIWMSVHARRAGGQVAADMGSAAYVLTRPFSLWTLIAMIAVFLFEPDAPLLVHEAAMLIAMVPVLRLTPPQHKAYLGAWPYAASALFLMMRLGFVVSASALLYRFYLIGLCVLGVWSMAWLLRRFAPGTEAAQRWRWSRQLRAATWIAVALLLASLVSNAVGNVSLAETLAGGVIDSGYLAFMLYAVVNVCAVLMDWLLRRTQTPIPRAASLARFAIRLAALAAGAGWLIYTMERFRVFRPVHGALSSMLAATFNVGELSISLGNVLVFVLAVLIAFWVARGARVVVHDEVLARVKVSRGVSNSVASLTYYGVLVLGLLVALSAAGFKVSQLTLVFSALGVGIGFGLQGVVSNFVAGLVLMFERPIQPGDVVDVGTTSGTVGDIGLRATVIRTFDGADVVVPNGTLVTGNLTNWTLRDSSRRIELGVGVGYGSQPEQVLQVLRSAAAQTPGIAQHPGPSAFFMEFGPHSLNFSVRGWTSDFDNWLGVRSDMAIRIHRALGEAGIEIPFPQQDLYLRGISEQAGAQLRPPKPAGA